jgi:hypothetical protein
MAIVTKTDQITALYVGYFNRAPDPAGLSYWVGRANAGMSINDIAISFSQQPEALSTYAYLAAPNVGNATSFVESIYLNLFNRSSDAAGLAYWVGQLTTGKVSAGLMIEAIIGGAQGTDATIMSNKVVVGEAYANALINANDTWTTVDNTASAKAALAGGSVFGATFVQVDATAGSVATNVAQSTALATALHNNPLQIVLTPNLPSISSGGSVDYSIQEAPSQAGKTVSFTINGASASEVAGNQLSGTVTLDANGHGTIHVSTLVLASNLGGANENVSVNVSGISSSTVTLAHGTQTVVSAVSNINEGSTFNVTVGTSLGSAAAGLVETYTITGGGLSQIPVAERSGTVTLDASGQTVVTLHTLATVFNSVAPNPTITIAVNGVSTGAVTINEVATQSVSVNGIAAPTPASINEGQAATFQVTTSGVAGAAVAGTVETWTLTGDAFVLSQLSGSTSGSVTLDSNGTAAVSVGTSLTVFNIGGSNTGSLTFNLFNNGAPVVTRTVTVNEATMTVSGNTADEGTPVTFTVTTNGVVPAGTLFHYHLSGAALGNIAPLSQTGSFTVSAGGITSIVLPTLANDPGGGTKSLTLTVDEVASASGSATINETAPFVLTTATDVFTGASGPSAHNTFIAVATSAIAGGSTIGQNDVLTGGTGGATNALSLTTSGLLPVLVTNFTTNGVEKFTVNANSLGFGGSTVDLSGASGLTTIIDANSGGSLLFTNATGPVNDLQLVNPTDLGVPVNLGLIYQIGAAPGTQNVTLDPTVSPITGLPNSRLTVNVPNFNIASNGPGINGLVALNAALPGTAVGAQLLGNVTLTGGTFFVNGLNGSGVAGMNFNTAGSHSLNLSGFTGGFANIGSSTSNATAGINNANGTLTITGGVGAFWDFYNPNVLSSPFQTGGSNAGLGGNATINSSSSVNIIINQGTFFGQQVNLTGGNLSVTGGANPTGGFIGNFNAASMTTAGGSVNVQGFAGGLGNSVGFPVFITTNGGALTLGTTSVVTGNIFANISTGGGTATVRLSAGINTLDFQAGTGFHFPDSVFTDGGPLGTNTLVLNANALGGSASGVQTINFNSGNMTTAAPINMALLNAIPALVPQQTINVNTTIGAAPALAGLVTTDIVNMNSAGTYTLDTGFITGNATLNLNVTGGSNVTLANTLNGGNTMSTLNFAGINNGVGNTLTLQNDNGLKNLNFVGSNNATIGTGSTGTGTINNITGAGGSYDLRGLVGVNVSGAGYTGTGNNANANANLLAAIGGTIALGAGNDQIAVGGGSWNINAGNGANTVVVNPTFTQLDTIVTGTGNDIVTVGKVGGGGGLVNINTDGGSDQIRFDNGGANPQLTSASIVQGGSGYDFLQIIGGNVNSFDALFTQIRGIEELDFQVQGVSNFLQLDFNAQQDVNSNDTGNLTIVTAGGNNPLSSNFINAGAGFTAPLILQVGAGGDLGGDNVTTHLGSGPLTVNATAGDFMRSFELNANTVQAGVKEGIFANMVGGVQNTLNLTPDGTFVIIDNLGSPTSGTHGVQTINGVFQNLSTLAVVLPAGGLSTDVKTVDLSPVPGSTQIWAQNATQNLVLKGGGAFFQGIDFGVDTMVGGSGNDTITGFRVWNNGGGVLAPKDFIWGGLGSDKMTGVGGAGNTGTDFVINSKAELNIQPNAISGDFITNFHGGTDTLFLNPLIFAAGTSTSATLGGFTYVGSGQSYSDVVQLLVGGGTGAGSLTEAVYEIDKGVLWVDLDNNGLLNASDIQIRLDWASPPAAPGTQISLNVAQFNGLNSSSNLFYNGTNVIPALNLAAANPITIPQWNFFESQGTVIGTTATFQGEGGTLTTDVNVKNYNFSSLTSGVTVTTPAFSGGAVMQAGTITGTTFDDSFFVNNADLLNGLLVNGDGGANDQITIDPPGPLVLTITNAMVQNIETLNLIDTLGNTISFGAGTGIKNINGSTGPDTINTLNMSAGGTIDLTNGGTDVVNLQANLAGSTIKGTGTTTVNSTVGGAITTTIQSVGNLKLVNNDNIAGAAISGATALFLASNAAVTLTGGQWNAFSSISSGNGTNTVTFTGNETVTSAAALNVNSLYNLGNGTNSITLIVGNESVNGGTGSDTVFWNNMVFAITGGTVDLKGGANHIVSFNTDIHLATIAATGGTVDFTFGGVGPQGMNMTNAQYNLFEASPGKIHNNGSDDAIGFTDAGNTGATLDGNVHTFVLANGTNSYALGAANQVVLGDAGADTIDVGSFAFTGNLSLDGGANVVKVHDGADIHLGSISGATLLLNFVGNGDTVTMTSGQENAFNAGGAMTGGTGATIIVTDNAAHVVLGVNEQASVDVVTLNSNPIVDLSVGHATAVAVPGWDLNTINLLSSNADRINLDNGGAGSVKAGTADSTHYDTITGFTPGPLANTDQMHLVLGGTAQDQGFFYITVPNQNLGNGTSNFVVDISAAVGSLASPTDLVGATNLINNAVGNAHGGADRADTFVLSTAIGAAIYEGHVHDNGAHNIIDGIQLVGVLTGVTSDQLVAHNFV